MSTKLYAGTTNGVYTIHDTGGTWQITRHALKGWEVCEVLVSADLFVSDDLSSTWERQPSLRAMPCMDGIQYPVPGVEPHVRDVTLDISDPRKMYVALQVGYMVRTDNGGVSWDLIDNGLDSDVHTIVTDPSNFERLTIATGGHDCRAGKAPGRALFASEVIPQLKHEPEPALA